MIHTNYREPLHPIDIQLGNFIESMGNIEIVTGIMKVGENTYQIAHKGWHEGESVIPDDVLMSTFPIPLTDEWRECFGIDQFKALPEWIKYVHECQNYFMWALRINIHDIMNWDLLPQNIDT